MVKCVVQMLRERLRDTAAHQIQGLRPEKYGLLF